MTEAKIKPCKLCGAPAGATQDQSADMQVRLLQNILDQLEKLNDTVGQWYHYGRK